MKCLFVDGPVAGQVHEAEPPYRMEWYPTGRKSCGLPVFYSPRSVTVDGVDVTVYVAGFWRPEDERKAIKLVRSLITEGNFDEQ